MLFMTVQQLEIHDRLSCLLLNEIHTSALFLFHIYSDGKFGWQGFVLFTVWCIFCTRLIATLFTWYKCPAVRLTKVNIHLSVAYYWNRNQSNWISEHCSVLYKSAAWTKLIDKWLNFNLVEKEVSWIGSTGIATTLWDSNCINTRRVNRGFHSFKTALTKT